MGTVQYGAIPEGNNEFRPIISITLSHDNSEITFVADKKYGPEQAQKVAQACFMILSGSHGMHDIQHNKDPYGEESEW